MAEDFRTLYVDPGEDTGWCTAVEHTLVAAGTTKLWPFADDVWFELDHFSDQPGPDVRPSQWGIGDMGLVRSPELEDYNALPVRRIVCEDFRIYPWAAKQLAWDQVRTARLIGALTFMARLHNIPFILQGAKIKDRAVVGGAEELFYKPLHENRHQNDAIMHFVFYTQTELRGIKLPEAENAHE